MFDRWQAVGMFGRFKVRPYGDGYGVWDGAANGWRSGQLSESDARDLAGDLDLQYDEHGPRAADSVRRIEPAQHVQRATWESVGVLDTWVRHRGQWWGRIRAADGQVAWVLAADLRPVDQVRAGGQGAASRQ
jgi:hypothetical protein